MPGAAAHWAVVCLGVLVAMCWLGTAVRRGFYRGRGVVVERIASGRLTLPAGWMLERNVAVVGLGDADLILTDPKKERWVVEIKSYAGARKPRWWQTWRPEITRLSGAPFSRDAIHQVLRLAERLNAEPLIWLPLAIEARPFRTRSGVLVVQGGRDALLRAIGARRSLLAFLHFW